MDVFGWLYLRVLKLGLIYLYFSKGLRNHNQLVSQFPIKLFNAVYNLGGNDARSLCSLVCKWNYEIGGDGKEIGWNGGFLDRIGLGDLHASGDFCRMGTVVRR